MDCLFSDKIVIFSCQPFFSCVVSFSQFIHSFFYLFTDKKEYLTRFPNKNMLQISMFTHRVGTFRNNADETLRLFYSLRRYNL